MVERLPYKRSTSGSIPTSSTKKKIVVSDDEKVIVRSFLDLFPGNVVVGRGSLNGKALD